MHRFAALAALALAGCASPSSSQPDIGALRSGQVPAASFDYLAWRTEAPDAFTTLQGEMERAEAERRDAPRNDPQCEATIFHERTALIWLRLAAEAPDRESWLAERAALITRLATLDDAIETYARGEAPEPAPPFAQQMRRLRDRVASASDPRLRELFQRHLRDQGYRYAIALPADAAQWTADLPPRAAARWLDHLSWRVDRVDCDNQEWLERQLTEVDWFDIPTYGEAADYAASQIANHARERLDLQTEVLARQQRYLASGATNQVRYAYLFDNVAISNGRPQRYGSQMTCNQAGEWIAMGGVEDPERLDERRASVRLEPWAQYRDGMAANGRCPERRAP